MAQVVHRHSQRLVAADLVDESTFKTPTRQELLEQFPAPEFEIHIPYGHIMAEDIEAIAQRVAELIR
jgi:hypothetical protein